MATTGTKETEVDEAPFSASTAVGSVVVAVRVTLRAPLSVAPSPRPELVLALRMSSANEAPIPNLAPVAPPERAWAPSLKSALALMVTSAVAPLIATVPRSRAEVLSVTRSIAAEPATPSPPPAVAPDFDFACSLPRVAAVNVSEDALAVPPTSAWFVASTLFTATAAPMPSVVEPELDPSALAVAFVVPFELSVNVLALTVTPVGTELSALVLAMLTAMPAATLIGTEAPLLSVALAGGVGLSLAPESPLPLAAAAPSAVLRWALAWWLTSPLPLLDGAPPALAVASDSVVELLVALKLTAPVALRLRAVLERTAWWAMVSARARPIAALPPALLDPVALVVTFPV